MTRHELLLLWWCSLLSAIISSVLFALSIWYWHIEILAVLFGFIYLVSIFTLSKSKFSDKDKTNE